MDKISSSIVNSTINNIKTIQHLSNDDRDDIYTSIIRFIRKHQVRLSICSTIEYGRKWLFIPCRRYRITAELISKDLNLMLKLSMNYDDASYGYKDIIEKLSMYLKDFSLDTPVLL